MTVGVGASGYVGIGIEVTPGTYVAPTHFFSLRNEGLKYVPNTVQRRPLRGTPDISGLLSGNAIIEGDLEIEIIEDGFVNLLRIARGTIVKVGAATPWTYTFTPSNVAIPPKTASITVVRNNIAFGYTGCVVSSLSITTDESLLVGTFSILGMSEADQPVPAAVFSALQPYSAGKYVIEVPTATQVFDDVNFTFEVNDNAEAQDRLKNTLGAQFVKYGEREVVLSMNRDFETRTEYDTFKTVTTKSIRVKASKSASQSVQITVPAASIDDYTVTGLAGQADLIMADIAYIGTNVGAGSYDIVVVSDVSITIP